MKRFFTEPKKWYLVFRLSIKLNKFLINLDLIQEGVESVSSYKLSAYM